MTEKIRVILPEKYDLVVGDTFQLFYRGVVEAPNPFCYDILVECIKGKGFPRYFEFTPTEVGQHNLKVSVYAPDRTLLGSAETILNIVEPEEPEQPINAICVGDSATANGYWVTECQRRLKGEGGVPEGLGYKNISFVGECGEETHFEAFGGWDWSSFLSVSSGDMWIWGEHEKTPKDQHSIWKDDNDNLWQLETIDIGRIKFTRYAGHKEEKPESGKLTHVKNATDTREIKFNRTTYERNNPFYDEKSNSINFKAYANKMKIDKIDIMYILLGFNGLMMVNGSVMDFPKEIVGQGKKFVDKFHKDFPDAKVVIMGNHLPSINGGMGSSHGASRPYGDCYGFIRYIFELNVVYQEWAKETGYRDFMEFMNVSGQFDTDNVYPTMQKPVNVRSTETEAIGTNGLHAKKEGYMQIADAVFRNMIHIFPKLKITPLDKMHPILLI